MQRLYKFLLILSPFVLILGGLEFAIYRAVFTFRVPPKPNSGVEPKTLLLSSNDITFTSDGASLHGWLIIGKPGYPALIVAHNYGSNRSDALGKLEGLVTNLNKRGYSVFLFDFRGHGDSSGITSLGYKESRDLEAAMKTVLKYRNIGRRVGILGIGMGAIAATEASVAADEVKFVILDSIYGDIPTRCTDQVLQQWPMFSFAKPFLLRAINWNLKQVFDVPASKTELVKQMPKLYPRAVLFVEKDPLNDYSKKLYDATTEPKELIQLKETAEGELIGESRTKYNDQVEEQIEKYFPAEASEPTMILKH